MGLTCIVHLVRFRFLHQLHKIFVSDRAREGELGRAEDGQGGKKGKAAKKDKEREERKRKRGEADAAEKQRKRNSLLEVCS